MEAVAEQEVEVEVEAQVEQDQPEAAAETPQPQTTPETPPAPAEELPAHIRDHYNAIREKEREVYSLEGAYLSLKEQAGEAKREFEQADKELRNLIARGSDPQRKLPFDEAVKEPRKPKRIKIVKEIQGEFNFAAGTEHDAIVDDMGDVSIKAGDSDTLELEADEFEVIEWENGPEPAATNEAWRTASFAELGLSAKQNDLFEAIGVTTIGGLEDLRARIAEHKPDAQWPKGIGPAKVTDIENRVIDWLDKNRDKFGEAVAPQDSPKGDVGKALEEAGILATDEPVIPEPADEVVPIHKKNGNAKKAKAKKRPGRASGGKHPREVGTSNADETKANWPL